MRVGVQELYSEFKKEKNILSEDYKFSKNVLVLKIVWSILQGAGIARMNGSCRSIGLCLLSFFFSLCISPMLILHKVVGWVWFWILIWISCSASFQCSRGDLATVELEGRIFHVEEINLLKFQRWENSSSLTLRQLNFLISQLAPQLFSIGAFPTTALNVYTMKIH